MHENQEHLNQLLRKLEILWGRHKEMSQEMLALRDEIQRVKAGGSLTAPLPTPTENKETQPERTPVATAVPQEPASLPYLERKAMERGEAVPQEVRRSPKSFEMPKLNLDLEKFIGENLISKIGVLILIIGVAIGAKYSIENNLISPLTRIVMGYITGVVLLGTGMKLKDKYENYSAVLVSGAMAILYFITFMAYSFYGLMPQMAAFGLMVLFTAFTVFAAVKYDRQVIAVIGLLGAYAVPLLLSDGSGDVKTLFSYVAIINFGILILSFQKKWKPLYYLAFVFTWLMYFAWYFTSYTAEHLTTAAIFCAVFFLTFYAMFLAYKVISREAFGKMDVVMLLANSFLFYAAGYLLFLRVDQGEELLGLFTLANAVLHFVVSVVLYRMELADKNLFYLVSSLVLLFITIAIPVQLDGYFVTIMWIAMAALLFWIGRTKAIPVYEKLSYPLMAVAFISLVEDWDSGYGSSFYASSKAHFTPLLNTHFLTSIVFAAALGFISYLATLPKYKSAFKNANLGNVIKYILWAGFVLVLYNAFRLEIANYWDQLLGASKIEVAVDGQDYKSTIMNYDYGSFKNIWLVNYSLLFVSVAALLGMKFFNSQKVLLIAIAFSLLGIFAFCTSSLYEFSMLRESYLENTNGEYFNKGIMHIAIRYISYVFLALGMWTFGKLLKHEALDRDFEIPYEVLIHMLVVWVASSELINLMDLADSNQSDKLGLSIFWGLYALGLIGFGIWKNKKHLRIAAIALFAITLIKLFLYDISHLDTISKTIVFVSLGVLLLVISFLYNKYKHIIVDE